MSGLEELRGSDFLLGGLSEREATMLARYVNTYGPWRENGLLKVEAHKVSNYWYLLVVEASGPLGTRHLVEARAFCRGARFAWIGGPA